MAFSISYHGGSLNIQRICAMALYYWTSYRLFQKDAMKILPYKARIENRRLLRNNVIGKTDAVTKVLHRVSRRLQSHSKLLCRQI